MHKVRAIGKQLKLNLMEHKASTGAEIKEVFRPLKPSETDGFISVSSNLNTKFRSLLVRSAVEKRIAIAGWRKEWVEEGALYSYAHDLASVGVPAAGYADRILKGANPGGPAIPGTVPLFSFT
jgi:ABC-type uncharacterized transport system substrate-binding protein